MPVEVSLGLWYDNFLATVYANYNPDYGFTPHGLTSECKPRIIDLPLLVTLPLGDCIPRVISGQPHALK